MKKTGLTMFFFLTMCIYVVGQTYFSNAQLVRVSAVNTEDIKNYTIKRTDHGGAYHVTVGNFTDASGKECLLVSFIDQNFTTDVKHYKIEPSVGNLVAMDITPEDIGSNHFFIVGQYWEQAESLHGFIMRIEDNIDPLTPNVYTTKIFPDVEIFNSVVSRDGYVLACGTSNVNQDRNTNQAVVVRVEPDLSTLYWTRTLENTINQTSTFSSTFDEIVWSGSTPGSICRFSLIGSSDMEQDYRGIIKSDILLATIDINGSFLTKKYISKQDNGTTFIEFGRGLDYDELVEEDVLFCVAKVAELTGFCPKTNDPVYSYVNTYFFKYDMINDLVYDDVMIDIETQAGDDEYTIEEPQDIDCNFDRDELMICGYYENVNGGSEIDGYTLRLRFDGNLIEAKNVGTTNAEDYLYKIDITSVHDYLLGGYAEVDDQFGVWYYEVYQNAANLCQERIIPTMNHDYDEEIVDVEEPEEIFTWNNLVVEDGGKNIYDYIPCPKTLLSPKKKPSDLLQKDSDILLVSIQGASNYSTLYLNTEGKDAVRIDIYNATGQLQYSGDISSHSPISLNINSSGIHLVSVLYSNGEKDVKKVVL